MQKIPDSLHFLKTDQIKKITNKFSTPVFVYSEKILKEQAKKALSFQAPYGLTVRYAMKANPLRKILQTFDQAGIHIDASSGYEAERAIMSGIAPERIMITAQELPENLHDLVNLGVFFNATSLYQLESYGKLFPAREISIRINPGIGSGIPKKTIVGGPDTSFGIWHEDLPEVQKILNKYFLHLTKIHTHIGSGTEAKIWNHVASLSLEFLKEFPEVHTLNLGGGFKVGRMKNEQSTDMKKTGEAVKEVFKNFYKKTGQKIHLEIEPGSFLTANAGSLITNIQDLCSTGKDGYTFLKINAGMTEILRPCLYGAKHPLIVIPQNQTDKMTKEYIVVGHCCESSDTITTQEHDAEKLETRLLHQAKRGDLLVIEGVGAYCSAMCTTNYNSFPSPAEIMITEEGKIILIKKRETIEEMVSLEEV